VTIRRFQDVQPGQPLPSRELNRALDTVERLTNFTGGSSCDGITGNHLAQDIPTEFWARIKGGQQPYSWIQEFDATGGVFVDANDSLQGTTTVLPALEVNGNTNVPANTKVYLILGQSGDQYLFSHCCGK
jgi:hypothetical protein